MSSVSASATGLVFDAGRLERLGVVVGRGDQQAAWAEVGASSGEDGKQVNLRRHVGDGVVDEDGVKRLAEPDGPHVPDVVGDAGIQRSSECESIASDRSTAVASNTAVSWRRWARSPYRRCRPSKVGLLSAKTKCSPKHAYLMGPTGTLETTASRLAGVIYRQTQKLLSMVWLLIISLLGRCSAEDHVGTRHPRERLQIGDRMIGHGIGVASCASPIRAVNPYTGDTKLIGWSNVVVQTLRNVQPSFLFNCHPRSGRRRSCADWACSSGLARQ